MGIKTDSIETLAGKSSLFGKTSSAVFHLIEHYSTDESLILYKEYQQTDSSIFLATENYKIV